MKANAIKQECELESSKLFGEVYLPDEWLENDIFSLDEFFLCQLNLSEINCENLPKIGYLYFFIETTNFKKTKMRAIVRYFEGEPDAMTDFNDGLFEDDSEYYLQASNDGNVLICEKNLNDNNLFDLLSLNSELLPFECDFNNVTFTINAEQLKNKNFSDCKLKFD